MRVTFNVLIVVVGLSLTTSGVFAQVGGTGTAGAIRGNVTDASGAVLPGVTVTATSPALIGSQVSVTDTAGGYRFPSLPPGTYAVTYDIPGFTPAKRENIQIAIGFTATVNVRMTVASVKETVQVTGGAPLIDTSSTHVNQSFNVKAMQEIPASRDFWGLLAYTPSVTTSHIDVGGSHAGNQFNYSAYGFAGQDTLRLEGINITFGGTTSSLYMDFGSSDEVSFGTVAQNADVATPGVQMNMIAKSGGNQFHGRLYQDYESNALQSASIPSDVLDRGIRADSNQLQKYRDFSGDAGGPLKKDKLWWYISDHNQKIDVGQPNFVGPIAGKPFEVTLWNLSGKATYRASAKHTLIGYYQFSLKNSPNNLPFSTVDYTSLDQTWSQPIRSWVYKGEWDGTLTRNMYAEVRYGMSSVSASHVANSDSDAFQQVDLGAGTDLNATQKNQFIFRRPQVNGNLTYFKQGWAGSHEFKAGGDIDRTVEWNGNTQGAGGNVQEAFNNGAPQRVILYAPTATSVGDPTGTNALLSVFHVTVADAYLMDQWSLKRATLNLGVRWDHYRGWSPDQKQLAYSFGPLNIPAMTFPSMTYFTWNKVVPRTGLAYNLTQDGRTSIKLSWGLYAFDPGIGLAGSADPNQAAKSVTYAWSDAGGCQGCIAGDGLFQPGEQGALLASALSNGITTDPNLEDPSAMQSTAYLERQINDTLAVRGGFVYYTVRNQVAAFQPYRPATAYTVPFTTTDPVTGQSLQFYGIPKRDLANFPATTVIQNLPNDGTYKTLELSLDKRQSHNYSVGASFSYTWQHDYPLGYPNTPNSPGLYPYSIYSAQAHGTYALPHGVLLSGTYRLQAGVNYARRLNVAAPASCDCVFSAAVGGSPGNTQVFVTPYNAYRNDNVSLLSLRAEKSFNIGGLGNLAVFIDGFNLTNHYAAETISVVTGSAFQKPTSIIGPRTARLGARFTW